MFSSTDSSSTLLTPWTQQKQPSEGHQVFQKAKILKPPKGTTPISRSSWETQGHLVCKNFTCAWPDPSQLFLGELKPPFPSREWALLQSPATSQSFGVHEKEGHVHNPRTTFNYNLTAAQLREEKGKPTVPHRCTKLWISKSTTDWAGDLTMCEIDLVMYWKAAIIIY